MGIEDTARNMRYDFLLRVCEEEEYDLVATAHRLEDNVETVLLNLIRGAGARGLSGIPPKRGKIVRPILDVSFAEIRGWLAGRGLEFVEDSSNAGDEYARNIVRHKILPILKDLNPQFAEHIRSAGECLREDEEYFESLAEKFLEENPRLCASSVAALPKPMAARVLRLWVGRPLSRASITALLELCRNGKPHGRVDIPGSCVFRQYDSLTLSPTNGKAFSSAELQIGQETALPELGISVRTEKIAACPEINNSLNIFFFQYDKLCGKLLVRSRLPGDILRKPERNCGKSLKKLFSESRVPPLARDNIPVIADDNGLLAVYGFGQDKRALARVGEPAIMVEIV